LSFKSLIWDYVAENAPETDKRDLLSELEIMKQLKSHPHVIKLLGCVTESGKLWDKTLKETLLSVLKSLLTLFNTLTFLVVESTNEFMNALHLQSLQNRIILHYSFIAPVKINLTTVLAIYIYISLSRHNPYYCLTSPMSLFFSLAFFSEPLLVLIEYVPFGDLLGYLRKSRGLNDTYYKDPDIKPKTSLTSRRLMKFAWQIADGMSYLSSKRVCNVFIYLTFMFCALIGLLRICTLLLEASHSNGFHYVILRRCSVVM